MDFKALGPLEVSGPDGPMALGSRKQQAVLAVLLVEWGNSVSADRLIDALWGEEPPKSAEHALHVHVSNLRKALDAAGGTDVIVTDDAGYRLAPNGHQFDVIEFEGLIDRARTSSNPGEASTLLRRAADLWRGRAYGDLADSEAVRPEAERLGLARASALEELFEAELAAGNHRRLIPEIERALSDHAYSERLWGALMLALYRSGRQAESLRAFGRLRTLLGEELGIEPGPDVASLEERILLQDPDLLLSGPATQGSLPAPISPLVGRVDEVAAVLALLGSSRLVTLAGPPGIGKSRLAIEVGERSFADFSGGVWHLDLSTVDSSELLGAAIAHAMRLDHRPTDDPVEVVSSHMGGRPVLLLLDGCEHVVEGVADMARRLLRSCPGLSILAASQVVLGVEGEAVFTVPPLEPTADAPALFRARAAAANARAELDQDTAQAICELLDGMPLALELAAVRLAVMTPEQLLEQLAEGIGEVAGDVTEGSRRTLEAALDWSVGLLPTEAADAYQRLGVFRGSFDVAGAAAVLDQAAGPALSLLAHLARHSLIETGASGGSMRYRMLDPMRRHARGRLKASPHLDSVRSRYVEHVKALAARASKGLRGADQLRDLDDVENSYADIRFVLGWLIDAGDLESTLDLAANTSRYWFLRSRLNEGWLWLERIIGLTDGMESVARVRALIAAGQFAWEQAADDRARRWLEEALRLARTLEAPGQGAWASAYLALLNILEEDDGSAKTLTADALNHFIEIGDMAGIGFATWLKVLSEYSSYFYEGSMTPEQRDEARIGLEPLLQAATAIGDRNLIGHLHWSLGLIELTTGDERARDHFAEAVRWLSELGNHSCICHVIDGLALFMANTGELATAARLIGAVEGLRTRIGNPGHRGERFIREQCHALLGEKLAPETLEGLLAEGRSRATPEEAIAMAVAAAG
jgi:predicted ATPase/DNA-binding SARP family transcriptional activator